MRFWHYASMYLASPTALVRNHTIMDTHRPRMPVQRDSLTFLALASRWLRAPWCMGIIGALALACLGACSDPVDERVRNSLGGYQTVDLTPVHVRDIASDVRDLLRFEPINEPGAWRGIEGTSERFGVQAHIMSVKMADSVWLSGPYPQAVERSGEFDAEGVNQAEIWIAYPDICRVQIEMIRGANVVKSDVCDVWPSNAPQKIQVRIRPVAAGGARFDVLRVRIYGSALEVGIRSIALQNRAPGSLVTEQPGIALIPAHADARRGAFVSTGRSLSGQALVGRGSLLHFSRYLPPAGIGGVGDIQLRVRLTAPDGTTQSMEYPVPFPTSAQSGWIRERVSIDADSVQKVSVEFELVNSNKCDTVCAVADVGVFSPPEDLPRTVVFITSDTHRADFVATDQLKSSVATPHLAALARRGVTFSDCASSANITNPSHVALMTGESPRDTGVFDNRTKLSESAPTLAESFHQLGYRTWACVSARHLRNAVSGLGQGFDRVDAPYHREERPANETLDVLESWLDKADGEPLFIWLHVFDAHAPYAPPSDYASKYWSPTRNPRDPALPELPVTPHMLAVAGLAGVRDPEFPLAQYRGEITFLDAQLARVLESSRFADAVVAFVADHGESFGEHETYYGHAGLYPSTIHVPMILAWPGAPGGTVDTRPVRSIDLGRTLLDIVGGKSMTFAGTSLLDPMRRASNPGHELESSAGEDARYALAAYATEASIRSGDFCLILHLYDHREESQTTIRKKHAVELYNLRKDPNCATNLVEDRPAIAKRLYVSLIRWLTVPNQARWAGQKSEDPALLAELAKLGYVEPLRTSSPVLWVDDGCEWCLEFR